MIAFADRNQYDRFREKLKSDVMLRFHTLIGPCVSSDIERLGLWDYQMDVYDTRLPGSGGDDFDFRFVFRIGGSDDMIEFRFSGFSDTVISEDYGIYASVSLVFLRLGKNFRIWLIKYDEKAVDLHDILVRYDYVSRLLNDLYAEIWYKSGAFLPGKTD